MSNLLYIVYAVVLIAMLATGAWDLALLLLLFVFGDVYASYRLKQLKEIRDERTDEAGNL